MTGSDSAGNAKSGRGKQFMNCFNSRHWKFNKYYFVVAVLLLGVEILIAQFAHDEIIRPYAGDFLVVILIYCCVKSFLNTPVLPTALCVLLFSYSVEMAQYFHAVNRLGLQESTIARIIIGTSFEWTDLLAYTLGIAFLLYCEKAIAGRKVKRNTETLPVQEELK